MKRENSENRTSLKTSDINNFKSSMKSLGWRERKSNNKLLFSETLSKVNRINGLQSQCYNSFRRNQGKNLKIKILD